MPPVEPGRDSGTSRPLPRALLALAAGLLVARVATGVWEERHPPKTVERVAWVEIERAEAESRRTRKPILYEFGAEWCGPCHLMSREVFANEAHAQQIGQSFVPVVVVDRQREEGRNPPEVERLERRFGITGFPTLVVAWPGDPRFEITSGYRGREGTMSWLAGAAARGRMRARMRADSTPGPR